ncbi:hypothetical protein, partial [Klebsiella pneumoniae]|uniref:hypothetical protein n=1 Tax=Klebsiella pneumoniae TaxID=573 RepID=UPI0026593EA4
GTVTGDVKVDTLTGRTAGATATGRYTGILTFLLFVSNPDVTVLVGAVVVAPGRIKFGCGGNGYELTD